MRVAIAGGGIAGLTSAIALAARGIDVALYERAPALRDVGAGIQLAPNATVLLDKLGVMSELAGGASEPVALAIGDGVSGAPLKRLPLKPTMRERYAAPYCTLLRADLQAALLTVARQQANVALHLGAEVGGVQATEGGVVFDAAGERRADVLLAADGIHSRIRQDYFRHPGARPLGQSAWRASMPMEIAATVVRADVVGLWFGRGGHLVHYPVDGGQQMNVVVIAPGDTRAPPAEIFGADLRQLLDKAGDDWIVSQLAEMDLRQPWCQGRVALLGDAAHAMAPSAAQGGAQAIEDACEIAERLSAGENCAAVALSRYEHTRRGRVARVARASRLNLNVYGSSGISGRARNIALLAMPAEFLLSRLGWVFDGLPR